MKALKLISLIFVFVSLTNNIFSQDKIYLKTKKIIECKIIEFGTDAIKYKFVDTRQDLTFSISKDKVRKVVFEDGTVMDVQSNEMLNSDNYIDDRPNAIKFNYLSPLAGSFQFSYEHSIKPRISLEGNAGIIGLGFNTSYEHPLGMLGGFGIKFMAPPDFFLENMKFAHILNGLYVNPNIQFSTFGRDNHVYSTTFPVVDQIIRTNSSGIAILISVGRQTVYSNVFLFDYNAGFGYGFTTNNNTLTTNMFTTNYNFISFGSQFPIAFSWNFRIGFLFNGKKEIEAN
ncbi:MAG: hypothetical protein AUJ98_07990 [Bacteroidetes bacterium CG2_30_33_31]|nr:MAG: hypothetical protein AUJ98_07990 [Bacteroidetes bacterium CG2_30_33_31]